MDTLGSGHQTPLGSEGRPVADTTATVPETADDDGGLKRSITGVQLFFYTLGDVLGSGIYVLIGLVAAAVGGAFWIAFAAGVTVAAITGSAYAELVTKYPQAAGSSLYVQKAFGNKALTFLVTVSFLAASFAAIGSLASGLRVVLLRALRRRRTAGAARVARLRRRPGPDQLHRHHRVGGDEHADDLRRAQRADHRHHHRHLLRRPGQGRLRDAHRHQRLGQPRRWRSSRAWRSPSSR